MADDDGGLQRTKSGMFKNTPACCADLSIGDQAYAATLCTDDIGQKHIFDAWPDAGTDDDKKAACLEQCRQLDSSYPGGIKAYVASARKLLAQSQRGENPLGGWSPSVPADGYDLTPGTADYEKYERAGLALASQVGFVVPAGGLGERLGFHGVKFELPSEVSTGARVLQVYADYMLATARAAEDGAIAPAASSPPLAIMVSDDTEAGIRMLLESYGFFGLDPARIVLLKQEKVAALSDANATFAMSDPYTISTKPHGHGDVHFLLHSKGICKKWHSEGIRWLHFFQDTNTLYFSNFLATLGVSATHEIAVNLVSCPRKAKEAVGAVCKLSHDDGVRTMVCNVEYNQLEPMLLAAGFSEGDVNEADTGFSKFPGNINQFIIDLTKWLSAVKKSNGAIDEFINPKYTDSTRTAFKSATRLECMMQDYVKTVPSDQVVAFTRYPLWQGYFPCKNDIVSAAKLSASGVPPHSASSSEMAVYHMHAQSLRTIGCSIAEPVDKTYRGVTVSVGPRIVLHPTFAPCFTLLQAKLPEPSKVTVSAKSTLVLIGSQIIIEELSLDGALVCEVADTGRLTIKSLEVVNDGWDFMELDDEGFAKADEPTQIRGYTLEKKGQRVIKVGPGEDIVVEKGKAKRTSVKAIELDKSMRRKRKPKEGDELDDVVIKVEKSEAACCVVQ